MPDFFFFFFFLPTQKGGPQNREKQPTGRALDAAKVMLAGQDWRAAGGIK